MAWDCVVRSAASAELRLSTLPNSACLTHDLTQGFKAKGTMRRPSSDVGGFGGPGTGRGGGGGGLMMGGGAQQGGRQVRMGDV
jgi:hypothetical protein